MTADDFKPKMGRKKIKVDLKKVAEMLSKDFTIQEMADYFRVTYGTMWRRIKDAREALEKKEGNS